MPRFRAGARGRGTAAGGYAVAAAWLALGLTGCLGPGLEPPWSDDEKGAGADSAPGSAVGGPTGNFGNTPPPASGTGGAPSGETAGMGGTGAMSGSGGTGAAPVTPPTTGSAGTGTPPPPQPGDPGGSTPPPSTDMDFSGCEARRIAPPPPTQQLIAPPVPPLADAGVAPTSCEYVLPLDAAPYLPDLLNVQVVTPDNTRTTLRRVDNEAACDSTTGGYYYDNALLPTRIVICSTHCGFPIEIVLGCPTVR